MWGCRRGRFGLAISLVRYFIGISHAISFTFKCGWLAGQCEDGVGDAEFVIGPWDCSVVILPVVAAD